MNEAIKKLKYTYFFISFNQAPKSFDAIVHETKFYVQHATLEKIESYKQNKGLMFLGIPHLVYHGIYAKKFQYIMMPRFTTNVRSLFVKNKNKMPMHTIFRLTNQIINVYEYIHDCQYVYNNLNSGHIMIDDNGSAYLVDFCMATPYVVGSFKSFPDMRNPSYDYRSIDSHSVSFHFYYLIICKSTTGM